VKVEQIESESDHWTLYLYAMKSPVTREKYQKRLGKFFDFLRLEGSTIEDKSRVIVEIARKDSNWTFSNILRFIQFQNSRVAGFVSATFLVLILGGKFESNLFRIPHTFLHFMRYGNSYYIHRPI
jgi:hypothetical protein